MQEKKKKLTGQQGELMRALDITPDDLMANDEGVITDHQRETVAKRQNYMSRPLMIVSFVFAVMGTFLPAIIIASEGMTDAPVAAAMAIGFLGAAILIQGARYVQREQIKRELERNELETVQGIAVVNVSEESAILEINGLKLKASPDVLRRVKHLDPYVIHYLPNSKVILSMEHISEDDNIRQDQASARLADAQENESYIVTQIPQNRSERMS